MQPSGTYRDAFYTFRKNLQKRVRDSFRERCAILLYHRVTTLPLDPQLLAVSPQNFYDQVNYIKKRFALLEVQEFVHLRKSNKPLPRKAVIITFDDGYADNYLEALPILESLKAQALFYISTSLLNTNKEFWWDELENIFLDKKHRLPEFLSLQLKERLVEFDLKSTESYTDTYTELMKSIKPLKPALRDQIITYLQEWSGKSNVGRATHRLMTNLELANMSRSSSAVIGAHTHNHPALSSLSFQEQELEIQTSKEILEKITNQKVTHFSYPFGTLNDYNSDSLAICKSLGFETAAANFPELITAGSDDFQLPRFLVRDWELNQFKQKMESFLSFRQ